MQIPIDSDPIKEAELYKMKFFATSLLGVAFVIFIVSTIFKETYVWVGFVQATAEAAMVGALADWFAVTALFRYPLNIKIPHTAIIPTRKDELGRTLGNFIKINFLTKQVISKRIRSLNLTPQLAEWISQADNSALIANQATVGMAAIVQVMRDEDIQALIEHNLVKRLRSTDLAPLLGNTLDVVMSGNRQQELLHGMIILGSNLLTGNKEALLERIGEETPWWLPKSVDLAIYQKIVNTLDKTLQEVSADPEHPLHQEFSTVVGRFVKNLQHSPDILLKEALFKEEILQQSVIQDFASSLWQDIKTSLITRSTDPNLAVSRSMQKSLVRLGETLLADEVLMQKIDMWLEGAALYVITKYGYELEQLIATTISNWDAEATSKKIELQVGKDLQFIRINGTIVGGLAGLLIHTLSFWL